MHRRGEFGVEEETECRLLHATCHPISVQRVVSAGRNLKIALWVTEIPAHCSAPCCWYWKLLLQLTFAYQWLTHWQQSSYTVCKSSGNFLHIFGIHISVRLQHARQRTTHRFAAASFVVLRCAAHVSVWTRLSSALILVKTLALYKPCIYLLTWCRYQYK